MNLTTHWDGKFHFTATDGQNAAPMDTNPPFGEGKSLTPKQLCLAAIEGGVPRTTVVDGREPHAVLLEVFTDEGVGTQVLPGVETKTRKARAAQ